MKLRGFFFDWFLCVCYCDIDYLYMIFYFYFFGLILCCLMGVVWFVSWYYDFRFWNILLWYNFVLVLWCFFNFLCGVYGMLWLCGFWVLLGFLKVILVGCIWLVWLLELWYCFLLVWLLIDILFLSVCWEWCIFLVVVLCLVFVKLCNWWVWVWFWLIYCFLDICLCIIWCLCWWICLWCIIWRIWRKSFYWFEFLEWLVGLLLELCFYFLVGVIKLVCFILWLDWWFCWDFIVLCYCIYFF